MADNDIDDDTAPESELTPAVDIEVPTGEDAAELYEFHAGYVSTDEFAEMNAALINSGPLHNHDRFGPDARDAED